MDCSSAAADDPDHHPSFGAYSALDSAMLLRDEIAKKFGPSLFERPLFYAYPGGLRFELSEGGTSIEQFLTALRKALTVSGDVFSGSDQFVLCLRTRVRRSAFACRELLRELRGAQICISADRSFWREAVDPDDWADDEEPESAVTLAFAVPIGLIQNALWCALAADLGIRPRLHCEVYLINLRTGVAVFPYDDRGMDVVGPNRRVLSSLYTKHQSLLLSYDLPQMQSTFGAV